MNSFRIQKHVQIVTLSVKGMSMRAVSRAVGVSINTVSKLLADMSMACADYQDRSLRDPTLSRLV